LDYEKVFDSVQRQILFNILEARNIPDKLLQAIVDMYRRNKISVKLNSECSEKVDIDKGVHQGCSLSPTLYIWIKLQRYMVESRHKRNPILAE
jgi:hypothetical protein